MANTASRPVQSTAQHMKATVTVCSVIGEWCGTGLRLSCFSPAVVYGGFARGICWTKSLQLICANPDQIELRITARMGPHWEVSHFTARTGDRDLFWPEK